MIRYRVNGPTTVCLFVNNVSGLLYETGIAISVSIMSAIVKGFELPRISAITDKSPHKSWRSLFLQR